LRKIGDKQEQSIIERKNARLIARSEVDVLDIFFWLVVGEGGT
jgi:hypothetical protein